MAEYQYTIVVDTDQELSDWELDELEQIVVDFITPDDSTDVTIS